MNALTVKKIPKKLSAQLAIFLFCAVFAPLWGLLIDEELTREYLVGIFLTMVIDIEIVWLLVIKIFKLGDQQSPREVTRVFLTRMGFFLISSIAVCTAIFILYIVAQHLIKGLGLPKLLEPRMLKYLTTVVKVTAIGILCSIPFFFFGQWQDALKREFKLKEENLIFQNETLKNQINPHFLFNSLNTLSSLINTQNNAAEHFINRLSSIYRYILENSLKDSIALQAELDFIKDYFSLHKARGEDKMNLYIDVKNADGYKILPVSLQLLIENAIKHNMATHQNPLNIYIDVEDNYVTVKNNLQKKATQLKSTQIGLKNLGERIRLTTGRELMVKQTNIEFTVKVPLML